MIPVSVPPPAVSPLKSAGIRNAQARRLAFLVAIWIVPYAVLGLIRLTLAHTELGTPSSWFFGFLGLQLFASVGVAPNVAVSRALLAAAAFFYVAYFAGAIPGLEPASSIAPQLCIAALMALSMWLPFSSGQLSLAQAGFMAIGAYVSAWLTVTCHWHFAVALPAAALATAAIGLLAGYPALRLRGIYLALATLGFGEAVRIFFMNFEPTGGAFGFAGIPKYTTLSQLLLSLIAVTALLILIMRSRTGRAIAAVRLDPTAASSLGIDVTRIRVLTFTLGALLAGLAGGFQAHYVRFISPDNYGLPALIEWLAAVMLGGFGTLIGPLAGTLVLNTTPELLHFLSEWRLAVYGAVLVALLLLRPEGIITREILGWTLTRGREQDDPFRPKSRTSANAKAETTQPLAVSKITKRFGAITAIEGVTFVVRRGTIHGIIGPNGAGKTTLFNIITGLQPADTGEILLEGRPVQHLRPHELARSGIARTFQNIRLFGDLTVLENVMIGGHVLTRSGALKSALRLDTKEEGESRARAHRLLSALGLASHCASAARTLSYGDQRRVEIARALAADPQLVLLDEPAAGMNATETAAFAHFIRRIVTEFGKTVLIIEHDMKLVMDLCDHVTVLNFGALIADGPPKAVKRNPAVIDAYLGTGAAQAPARPARRPTWRQHPPVLEVDGLVARYDHVEALEGVSLAVHDGEIVTLIGANGAGKTTTLRSLSGMLCPADGTIKFRGEDITGLPPQLIMQRGISHVVEGRGIFSELTVAENLGIGAYSRSDRAGIQRDLKSLLDRFPRLAERRNQRAGTLSGGEQQMLAIARALISKPRLLLLDEPSMGLAPTIVDHVFELIRDINREGTAILLVEQNATRALETADHAYVMATGRIVASGKADTLIGDPQLSDAYLGGQQGSATRARSYRPYEPASSGALGTGPQS